MGHAFAKITLPVLILAGACAHTVAPPATPAPVVAPAAQQQLPNDIRWSRRSAEHRALFLQTFALAADRLSELTRGLAPQSWAIITDADETVLDNSLFEEQQAITHAPYSETLWNDFVRSEVSTALPGAAGFFQRVHELGGKVVVVTNRAAETCDVTKHNLAKAGLAADQVLCHPPAPASGDKNPRFRSVQESGLKVVMWLGDNIQDFPDLGQQIRNQPDSAFAHFGRDYFLLPNPMYGSWEKN